MKKIINIVVILVLFTPLGVFAEQIPPFPMAFWGNAAINNSPAPIGSVIRAYSSSVLVGQVIIIHKSGIYGYTDSTKQKLLVGNAIGSIIFSIQHPSLNGGAEIFSTASEQFTSGSTINKNLSFSFTIQTPPATGSGGGAVSILTSPLSATAQKVDSNKDNKIDILDFNSLMIHWGKTTTNNIADFNNDGKVDIFDFNSLMINWTK